MHRIVWLAGCAGLIASLAFAQVEVQPSEAKAPHAKVVTAKSYYPDGKCLVRGRKLGKGAVTLTYQGRTIKVCCKRCAAAFEKEPEKYLKKLDERIAESQRPGYPLTTCPISGEKLGAMGKPHEIVVQGRLVRLCCEGCAEDVAKNPSKVLARIDAALLEKKGDRAAKCPVSGKKVAAGKGVNLIWGTEVVRLCCPRCVKAFEKSPAKLLERTRGEPEGEHRDGDGREAGEARGHGEHRKGQRG